VKQERVKKISSAILDYDNDDYMYGSFKAVIALDLRWKVFGSLTNFAIIHTIP
jgi:hypothetical protein